MATWNSPNPLKIPVVDDPETRRQRGAGSGLRFTEVNRGEPVPEELMTAAFIGGAYNQLTNLTSKDVKLLQEWKTDNPRISDRWDYLDRTGAFAESNIVRPPNGPGRPAGRKVQAN